MPTTATQLTDLENFFAKTKLPKTIQLDEGSKLVDVPNFVQSHLNVLKANPDKPVNDVFYTRLLRLKELIAG